MSELPARPSKEHLRKQAKRLARDKSLGLAEAQRKVAADYGAGTWADLMRRVDAARGGEAVPLPPLAAAARAGDLAAVRRLIAEGQPLDDGGADDRHAAVAGLCLRRAGRRADGHRRRAAFRRRQSAA